MKHAFVIARVLLGLRIVPASRGSMEVLEKGRVVTSNDSFAENKLQKPWSRNGSAFNSSCLNVRTEQNMNSSPACPSSVSATLASADHYRRLRIFVFGWVLVMMGAYCVCTNVFAQTSNSRTVEEPKPWTVMTDSKSGDQTPERMPVRIIESHSQDGNRTSDKRSIEIRGTDGHLEPYQEIETETVNVDASTSRSTMRTFAWDVNGNKSLVQETEEETRILPGGDSKVTRLTSNPDLSGTLQPVQREIVETKKLGMEREETNVTVMLPSINGGLAPAFKTYELRTRSANNAIESQKTTLLPDGAGNWQVSEVRQATTTDEGASRTTEERVSRPDLEGKLSEISRAVSKESESTPGEKRNVVETYSVDVPGATRDGKLHLIERKTSTEKSSSSGERATEQTIEQPNLGDSGSGLRVSVLVNGRTVPGPSGERSTVTVRARDLNGNLGIVSVDTTKSDRIPMQIQQTPAAKP